jgi:hypothetical protein
MKIQVYDPPMCCPTGVCGPAVDPALATFAGFLQQMKERGAAVERFNLAQQPLAFVQHAAVRAFLDEKGAGGLPLIFLDGTAVLEGRYPEPREREEWLRALTQTEGEPA